MNLSVEYFSFQKQELQKSIDIYSLVEFQIGGNESSRFTGSKNFLLVLLPIHADDSKIKNSKKDMIHMKLDVA